MPLRPSWTFAVLSCLLVCGARLCADNVAPPVTDAAENAALLQLANAEHHLSQHRYHVAIPKLDSLLLARPAWDRAPWLELLLAIARTEAGQHADSLANCVRLRDVYRESQPLLAAWAQLYAGENLERMGLAGDAMRAYRQTDEFLPYLTDLGPVLKARHKAGEYFLRNTRREPSRSDHAEVLNFDPEDDAGWAWAHGAVCARRAWCGEVETAYREYRELVASLPPGDRRVAVAGIDLAIGEIDAYDDGRRVKMDMLVHAQDLVRQIESEFPTESWLVARGKMRMAMFELRHKVGLQDAERYFREVIEHAGDTDLLPEAHANLAQLLFEEGRYEESVREARVVADRFAYSTWADFGAFVLAESLHRAGRNGEAFGVLDQIISRYAGTDWANLARQAKEVYWK